MVPDASPVAVRDVPEHGGRSISTCPHPPLVSNGTRGPTDGRRERTARVLDLGVGASVVALAAVAVALDRNNEANGQGRAGCPRQLDARLRDRANGKRLGRCGSRSPYSTMRRGKVSVRVCSRAVRGARAVNVRAMSVEASTWTGYWSKPTEQSVLPEPPFAELPA